MSAWVGRISRQGRGRDCSASSSNPMMEGPPGADSEEKHEPVSDIDTVVVDSLKALDPEWPIREADIVDAFWHFRFVPKRSLDHLVVACEFRRQHFEAERPLTGVRFVMDRRQFLGVRAQYPLRTARRVCGQLFSPRRHH